MPTPVGGDKNTVIPHLYMFLYKNRKSKKHLSSHSKKVQRSK